MKKGLLKIALLSAVCASMPAAITSCKNYDDDLDQIRNEMGDMKVDITKLQALIEQGCVITGVSQSSDGVVFTTSDGKTYSISNGKDGKPGTAWTIGDDGYWYENGTKTNYRAIGEQGVQGPKGDTGAPGKDGVDGTNGTNGKDGADGKDGVDGKDGANGQYYVPNVETGMFDIYQDGKKIGESNISWRSVDPATVSAVYNGNKVVITCLDAAGNQVTKELYVGTPVSTIAFIPSVLSTNVPGFATTDKPFYHIDSYLDEAKYNASTKAFIPQTQWNKSNIVELDYRLSPQDATVAAASFAKFINRAVTTRAAGDKTDEACVLGVHSFDFKQANETGVLPVQAYYNKLNKTDRDLAAMVFINGQEAAPYTTDYVAAESKAITAVIADPSSSAIFTARTKSINDGESSAFIQSMMPLSASHDLLLSQKAPLDLAQHVALWSPELRTYLTSVAFEGISFEFTMPKEYLANDETHTNQQHFASLDGSVLTAQTGASAVDRTPVVRVDAFMTDNTASAKRLVASAYIKMKIVDGKVEQADITNPISAAQTFDYHALTSAQKQVAIMNWLDVNHLIYDVTNLKATAFWGFYGGATDEYTVEINAYRGGRAVVINAGNTTAHAGTPYSFSGDGIFCDVTLVADGTETSTAKLAINNNIKTQNTYDKVTIDGKEATKYHVVITIKSDDRLERGNVVLTQDFYVFEVCPTYTYSPSYLKGADRLEVNGRINSDSNKWEMEANIAQLFRQDDKGGQEIFQYYNTFAGHYNITDINFSLVSPTNGDIIFTPTVSGGKQTAGIIKLVANIADQVKTAKMKYTLTLVNGETCEQVFYVDFANPFKAGAINGGASFNGNNIGALTVNVAKFVNVIEDVTNANHTIYNWSNAANALALSDYAKNNFNLTDADVQVTYAFKADSEYNTFKGNLDPTTVFNIDANGVINYQNQGGAKLQRAYNLTVEATITFNGHIIVKNEIPVQVTTK